jgi:excinuclease UvrABC nuclease subunit
MSAKEELEKLAMACEECVGKDDASIDEHLESCPVCREYRDKAERLHQMLEVMQMLASKPEEERRRILQARMEQFSALPEDERVAAIADMLDGLSELSGDDRVKIVKTRTDIITSLPREKREVLMGSLRKVMASWSDERKMMEKQDVMAATQDYFILKRMLVRMMFKKMLA